MRELFRAGPPVLRRFVKRWPSNSPQVSRPTATYDHELAVVPVDSAEVVNARFAEGLNILELVPGVIL